MDILNKSMLLPSLLAITMSTSTVALAGKRDKTPKNDDTITLMQLQDVHGHMAPHNSILLNDVKDPNAGGLAKLTTLIKQVRNDNPNNLLLLVEDTTHGSAETLFTMGESMMPWLNSLGIDAFLPGNWGFGWGLVSTGSASPPTPTFNYHLTTAPRSPGNTRAVMCQAV